MKYTVDKLLDRIATDFGDFVAEDEDVEVLAQQLANIIDLITDTSSEYPVNKDENNETELCGDMDKFSDEEY